MKKSDFLAIIFLALTTLGVSAQSLTDVQTAAKPASSESAATKPGKVDLPPEKRRPMNIPKTAAPPTIDGKVDEESWKQAAVFKDFYQTYPGNNTAPSKPTEAYLMYDEHFLYVAFKCWDEKDKIRATVAKRDQVFGEDNVRLWLDTYNDQRRAYVIGFNPLGIQQDGVYTEGSGADFSIDLVMESKGVIEDWGWSVEAKIPFKSIRYKTGKGVLWGFNVARNIDRFNDEFDQWLPDDRDISGFLVKHGKISGLEDIKYERTLEVVPSVTVSETGSRVRANEVAAGRFVNEPVKKQLGVTLKYTVTPSVTLDAAINPDFAEIEADAPVVTANQRFPIYYQEKRPFFLEGVDIFNTPIQVFYSRNIVDPDVAFKLSGKTGKTSFGILAASDNAPGNYSPDERTANLQCLERRRANPSANCSTTINEFVDKNAMFGVVRLKRDIGRENNIGFITTYRSFPEKKNLLAAVDGRIKLSPATVLDFQVAGSTTRRCTFDPTFEPTLNVVQAQQNRSICGTGSTSGNPLANGTYQRYRTGNGMAYSLNLDNSTDTRGWELTFEGTSSLYRADSGFTSRTNTNKAFLFHRFSSKTRPKANIIRSSFGQFTDVTFDWAGRLQAYNLGTNVNLNLKGNAFAHAEFGGYYEKLYEEEFGLKRSPTRRYGTFLGGPTRGTWQQYASVNYNQQLNKKISYGVFAGLQRNAFDYFFRQFDPVSGLTLQNPGPGMQYDASVSLEVKPIDPFRVSVSYNKSRLTRNDNRVRSFDSDIVSIRSTYYFTRFIFTRFRLDYDGTDKNYAGQGLMAWTPSPGTALYVGYNDNVNRSGYNPFSGDFERGFHRNSRTFFIRMSYLFRRSF